MAQFLQLPYFIRALADVLLLIEEERRTWKGEVLDYFDLEVLLGEMCEEVGVRNLMAIRWKLVL